MSMIPFFPSLRPPIANRMWLDINAPINNEENEILRYEREHHAWLESTTKAAADINPLGKILTVPGPEMDDEDANDDSDDSSHDDEDTNDDTNDRPI